MFLTVSSARPVNSMPLVSTTFRENSKMAVSRRGCAATPLRTLHPRKSLHVRRKTTARNSNRSGNNPAQVQSETEETSLTSEITRTDLKRLQLGTVGGTVSFLASEGSSYAMEMDPLELVKSVSSSLWEGTMSVMTSDLWVYFLKTVIAWGVPVGSVGIVVLLALSSSKKDQAVQSGEERSPFAFGRKKPGPKEYLTIERLNERLSSYDYSFRKASDGERRALENSKHEERILKWGINSKAFTESLSLEQLEKIDTLEKRFATKEAQLKLDLDVASKELRKIAADAIKPSDENEDSDGGAESSGGMFGMGGGEKEKQLKKISELVSSQMSVEQDYIAAVSKILNSKQATSFQRLLKSKECPGFGVSVFAADATKEVPHVYVVTFNGDVQASQVAQLRQEVTAVLRNASADRGDELVLVLNTGGGTVTGYGLAAAQLMRVKDAGVKLTICVEQVAASGGYMMACTADRLVASPFAVLGSIGVISEQPNVYERLKKEGVEFQTVTAGKFKRTLTPFKKPTKEDFDKQKDDIESILVLFKSFVAENRPKLDIDTVATGETWFGKDALARNLVDELITTDDVLLQKLDSGAEIFSVKFGVKRNSLAQALQGASVDAQPQNLRSLLLTWLLQGDGGLTSFSRDNNYNQPYLLDPTPLPRTESSAIEIDDVWF